jgi:hypothetical protein
LRCCSIAKACALASQPGESAKGRVFELRPYALSTVVILLDNYIYILKNKKTNKHNNNNKQLVQIRKSTFERVFHGFFYETDGAHDFLTNLWP